MAIPSGVTVTVTGNLVEVSGPKGKLQYSFLPNITVCVVEGKVIVGRENNTEDVRARHGLTRALIANMVRGVSQGYEKSLEIIGVGYKVKMIGKKLELSLGFSHPIIYALPEGIIVEQEEKKNTLRILGISKELVGQVAADIRHFRPPEPYKGKGIRYLGEVVRRKVGKAAVTKGTP